jgi:hypothetical protein
MKVRVKRGELLEIIKKAQSEGRYNSLKMSGVVTEAIDMSRARAHARSPAFIRNVHEEWHKDADRHR